MAQVDGRIIEIGDYIYFKDDVEQSGTVVKIRGDALTILINEDSGEEVVMHSSRCWTE